jgi:hypothetical protein
MAIYHFTAKVIRGSRAARIETAWRGLFSMANEAKCGNIIERDKRINSALGTRRQRHCPLEHDLYGGSYRATPKRRTPSEI